MKGINRLVNEMLEPHPQACKIRLEAGIDRFGEKWAKVFILRDTGSSPMSRGDEHPYLSWGEASNPLGAICAALLRIECEPEDTRGYTEDERRRCK